MAVAVPALERLAALPALVVRQQVGVFELTAATYVARPRCASRAHNFVRSGGAADACACVHCDTALADCNACRLWIAVVKAAAAAAAAALILNLLQLALNLVLFHHGIVALLQLLLLQRSFDQRQGVRVVVQPGVFIYGVDDVYICCC